MLRQLAGVAVLAIAVALGVALVTFNPEDPSFNSAVSTTTRNLLGSPGAHAADLLLQSLGLSAAILVLATGAWSWPLLCGRSPARIWLRIALLPLAVVLAALSLAAVTPMSGWPLKTGFGGAAGEILLASCERLATWLDAAWLSANVIGAFAGVLAGLILIPVLALDLRTIATMAYGAGRLTWSGGHWLATRVKKRGKKKKTAKARSQKPVSSKRIEPVMGEPSDTLALSHPDEEHPPPPKFLVETPTAGTRRGRRAETERQKTLELGEAQPSYQLPELDLLDAPTQKPGLTAVDQDALSQNAQLLESVLEDFGVRGDIVKIRPGPVVTLYEFVPAPGTKTSRVIGLSDDIARSMSAVSVRVAVIPGRNAIGIEMPNMRREIVFLRELLESASYERASAKLPLVLGKDIGGSPIMTDLARMPHLLIAGTTGSGKSVAINTMILSLLYRLSPDQCKFIMIDPKMLELSVYDGIPQLLAPVVTDPQKAIVALKWAVREMESRYQAMAKLGVRNVEGYNVRIQEARRKGEVLRRKVQTGFDADTGNPVYEDQPLDPEPLPYLVVIVDEMADLMLVAGKDIEAAVQRLAQMARAAGIHLIMATQRPSVDVITGTIKANFPTRISFQVTSKIDSRTILGEQGAETLLGQGDMLYMAGGGRITRVHGPFVSDIEVEEVVQYLKGQGAPSYVEAITEDDDGTVLAGFSLGGGDGEDALYRQAVELVLREQKASTSFVQRHLQIGYNRAARLIERMESEGLISAANHVGRREILAGSIDE